MKLILGMFIGMLLLANTAKAQDTIYVYYRGDLLYKTPMANIDGLGFTDITKKNDGGGNPVVNNNDTVSDNDGHIYHYKQIGTQIWMIENMRTAKYRNGDVIDNLTVQNDWVTATSGAWCAYDNDSAKESKYGKLYNWYAVNDSRNIAPPGWHVATDADWITLEEYTSTHYGTSLSTAKALAATTDWIGLGVVLPGAILPGTGLSPIGGNPVVLPGLDTQPIIKDNLSINNSSGFSALPGGFRNQIMCDSIGSNGYWWTSTDDIAGPWVRDLSASESFIRRLNMDKTTGMSIRCVKD